METAPVPPPAAPTFAVIIPMFNEEAGAATCIRRVSAALDQIPEHNALIVVNDGSGDRTADILQGGAALYPRLVVVTHPANRGYGAALKSGAARATQEGFLYALFMDSDLTNDPADLPRFVAKMREGHDVIKATRYSQGGRVEGVPAYRVMISRVGNLIAGLLFHLPLRDCTNGFRAVKTSLLSRMELHENRFPVIMEELYFCKFLTRSFASVPVVLTNRSTEQRVTSFRYRPAMFWAYLKYPLKSFLGINPLRSSAAPPR